jgi:hypothetical protein
MGDELNGVVPCSSLAVDSILRVGTVTNEKLNLSQLPNTRFGSVLSRPVPDPYPTRTKPVPGIFFFGQKRVRRGYACSGTPAVSVPTRYPVRVRRGFCRTGAS